MRVVSNLPAPIGFIPYEEAHRKLGVVPSVARCETRMILGRRFVRARDVETYKATHALYTPGDVLAGSSATCHASLVGSRLWSVWRWCTASTRRLWSAPCTGVGLRYAGDETVPC